MKKITSLILLTICAIGLAGAQANLEIVAPFVVAEGEKFHIKYILTNAKAESFNGPSFTGLEVIAGPIRSDGSTYNSGSVTPKNNLTTYTYTVKATASSRASISAAAVITEDGRTLTTKATHVEIRSIIGSTPEQPNTNPSTTGTDQQIKQTNPTTTKRPVSADLSGSVFLRTEVNKTNVHKGEPILVTIRIYTQIRIIGFNDIKTPAFNGFWQQEIKTTNPQKNRVTVGGKAYESEILKQWLMFPLKTGTLTIEQCSMTAVALIELGSTNSAVSVFDNFHGNLGPETTQHNYNIAAPTVLVNVKELPQPEPDDFGSGVGRFSLSSKVTSSEIMANSGGTLRVTISGAGNLPLIDPPTLQLPKGLEQFETKTNEQITHSTSGSNGSRTWEFPFIARNEGEYTLPGVTMSYFDPSTRQYKTMTSHPIKLKVTKDLNPDSNIGVISGITKDGYKTANNDIFDIYTDSAKLHTKSKLFLWSPWFFIIFIVIIGGFVAALIVLQQQIKNRTNIVLTKTKKANSVAIRRLGKAKVYMDADETAGFYEELLRTLWGYMGDKLSIPVSDLSKERVRQEFEKRNIPNNQGEELLELIADCEMAQYSPSSSSIGMQKTYQTALNMIGSFEIKK